MVSIKVYEVRFYGAELDVLGKIKDRTLYGNYEDAKQALEDAWSDFQIKHTECKNVISESKKDDVITGYRHEILCVYNGRASIITLRVVPKRIDIL